MPTTWWKHTRPVIVAGAIAVMLALTALPGAGSAAAALVGPPYGYEMTCSGVGGVGTCVETIYDGMGFILETHTYWYVGPYWGQIS